jgi:hypothetical protein
VVKIVLLTLAILCGFLAVPPSAAASCNSTLADCYTAAAKVDSFWYRWAAGIDCELDYAECVRIMLLGA